MRSLFHPIAWPVVPVSLLFVKGTPGMTWGPIKKERVVNKRTFVEPKVYKSKDQEFLEIVLPGDLIVRKHINYFKAIMGVPFTPRPKKAGALPAEPIAQAVA
ncbi:MAG: hypothetical protein HYZ71_14240 [Deltaproteobacteria bacterium]|nr:hypothetical protein [Deltaproteobacteria bacterium]